MNRILISALRTIKNTAIRWLYRIWHYMSNAGSEFVSFHGPDGAGKSTLISHFAELYSRVFIVDAGSVSMQHFRPHLFPNARAIIAGNSYDESKENYQNPHRGIQKKFIPSFLAITYYYFDYLVGYFLNIKRDILYHRLVIYDRYVYDILADQKRLSLCLPYWLRACFVKITPRPSVSFVLHGPPDLVFERKQELPLDEIKVQVSAYKKIADDNRKRFMVVDITRTPDEIALAAMSFFIRKNCEPI